MRVMLASGRGLLGGWLVAKTLALLTDSRSIAVWSTAGFGDRSRIGLVALELAGAVLFAFEASSLAGLVLLFAAFIAGAIIHSNHDEIAWWLAVYSMVATLLFVGTGRARRAGTTVA